MQSLLDGLETNVAGLMPYVEKRLGENEAHLDATLSAKALTNMANLGLIMLRDEGGKGGQGQQWVKVPGKYDDDAAIMALLLAVRTTSASSQSTDRQAGGRRW